MAVIKSFCGYRFNCSPPGAMAKFVAPPYDMLSSAMVDELYAKDPANIVRITQNRPCTDDTANRTRHERAASTLEQWIHNGVLRRDDAPSVYVYEQRFSFKSGSETREAIRTGVIVLVELTPFEKKVVVPHEATLSGPKKDRYELLDATRTHTEQIFGLLDDDGPFYEQVRAVARGSSPEGTFTDGNGVVHSLFRCRDTAVIERMVTLAKGKTILIADGHHRYETGLNFHRDNPRPEYAFTMMTLVSTADPGLVIRPFHRLVKKAGRAVAMSVELARYFTLTDHGNASAVTMRTFLDSPTEDEDILYYDAVDGHLYGLSITDNGKKAIDERFPDHCAAWKRLPVSIINVIVVNTILDLPLDGHVLHDIVEYIDDSEAAMAKCADAEKYHGGFFIRPARIGAVSDVVASGDRMPQKSTNFYPKIYSGLVMYRMDDK